MKSELTVDQLYHGGSRIRVWGRDEILRADSRIHSFSQGFRASSPCRVFISVGRASRSWVHMSAGRSARAVQELGSA